MKKTKPSKTQNKKNPYHNSKCHQTALSAPIRHNTGRYSWVLHALPPASPQHVMEISSRMHSHAQEQGVFSFVPTRLLGFYLCLGLQAAAKMGAEAPCQSDTQVRQRERGI